MKATTSAINEYAAAEKSRIAIIAELVKARLTSLVLLTTTVGFLIASRSNFSGMLLLNTLMGTGLLACGAAALNQLLERSRDGLMTRTADRPLPAGDLTPEFALIFGGALSGLGLLQLALFVNPLTALLGALTLGGYLFLYTPLKRVTSLNTVVGAVPGAIPPLMGWTAARGEFSVEGWTLFAILFFWQLPHFLAIAWLYREDYAKAGFVMLPVIDRRGVRTGRWAMGCALGLLSVSLLPTLLGISGWIYFAGALALGAGFLVCAVRFSNRLSIPSARGLFFASIIYLPLILGLMVIDKV